MKETIVFGIPYHNLFLHEAARIVDDWLSQRCRKTLLFLNADYFFKARDDREYAVLLRERADLVLPDGVGLNVISRIAGQAMKQNCNGTDFVPEVLRLAQDKGLKVFFLGAANDVVSVAAANFKKQFPDLCVAGVRGGYFKDERVVLDEINRSGADILLVGMGAPKQEKWIVKHRDNLSPLLCVGVGGLFKHYANKPPRAPLAMRKMGMEWVWRICMEPDLFFRYFVSGVRILGLFIGSLSRFCKPSSA